MPLRTSGPVALAALVSFSAFAHPARADVKQACVDASTTGQSLRDASKLYEAREQFVECARDACPAIVRKACADWLADVDHRLPSVVFRAQAADGSDVVDARLSLDGAPLAHALDGAAVPIDPGEHVVRFERGGAAPVEERVVIVEGERGRVVTGRFAATTVATTPTPHDTPSAGKRLTPLTLVLAGVGGVGLIGFASFGVVATNDLNHLRQTCAPYCSASQLGSVKTEALVADVSLGVGVAALAAAAYVFFTQKTTASTSAVIDVRLEHGGAFAQIGARF
jgi:hypothetical protein